MHAKTPFGNPDGSRSDIREVVSNFVSFEELNLATGLGIRPEDLSVRVIVGAKGSGKTVYLRRLRAAAVENDSVYASTVQQDLPSTSNIVKFCQCFGRMDLTEKWMKLWYCAILRCLVTHVMSSKQRWVAGSRTGDSCASTLADAVRSSNRRATSRAPTPRPRP